MLAYLKQEANRTYTENGAASYISTLSAGLDLFGTIGALRNANAERIIQRFQRAFAEDPDLAMKILFFARDIRGGLGERRVFRVILRQLAFDAPDSVRRNIRHVPRFGRWDDLLSLMGTPVEDDALALIREQFASDLQALEDGSEVSLLGKWLPSVNASDYAAARQAARIARAMGMRQKEYRQALSRLRARIRIIENHLRQEDYSFDYEKQPSRAMYRYRKAFHRHDHDRYQDYLDQVSQGLSSMHTGTLAPYDIIAPFVEGRYASLNERRSADVAWNAQEDFTNGENALVVVDGSGSMYWSDRKPLPAAVALSLGIYFAERNTGAFRDHFITFSNRPQLVQIQGRDIYEKVNYARNFNEIASTNIQRVFELILDTAVKHRLPQSQLPSTLYIISDMEFNFCIQDASLSNFEYARQRFAQAGYQLPRVVFWNVNSRNDQQPVTMHETGVALVSGASPRIFRMLSSGRLDPMEFMMDILGSERYADISA